MRSIRQQYQSRQGRSLAQFAAAMALALLIVAGGAAVTLWNTLDVMAALGQ